MIESSHFGPPFLSRYSPNSPKNSRLTVRPRLQLVEDLAGRLVADAQLVFVDERVVDAVDRVVAQLAVVQAALELLVGDVVLEAEGFEEVLVDDVRAGR